MKQKIIYVLAVLIILIGSLGLFYSNGGNRTQVTSKYGEEIELYGDGIYAYDSVFQATTYKGTDIAAIIFGFALIIMNIKATNSNKFKLMRAGVLSILLYLSICYTMEVSFNRIYLLYLVTFSMALFLNISELSEILHGDYYKPEIYEKKLTRYAVFLFCGGSSVLVWLIFILPAVMTGETLSNIGVGTTIPTFTLDLGIILPTTYYCGYSLLKKRRIGYQLAPVLFVAIICVGIAVISQTIMQLLEGIHIEPGQFVGLVGTFVVLGVFAIVLNYRMLRWVRE